MKKAGVRVTPQPITRSLVFLHDHLKLSDVETLLEDLHPLQPLRRSRSTAPVHSGAIVLCSITISLQDRLAGALSGQVAVVESHLLQGAQKMGASSNTWRRIIRGAALIPTQSVDQYPSLDLKLTLIRKLLSRRFLRHSPRLLRLHFGTVWLLPARFHYFPQSPPPLSPLTWTCTSLTFVERERFACGSPCPRVTLCRS